MSEQAAWVGVLCVCLSDGPRVWVNERVSGAHACTRVCVRGVCAVVDGIDAAAPSHPSRQLSLSPLSPLVVRFGDGGGGAGGDGRGGAHQADGLLPGRYVHVDMCRACLVLRFSHGMARQGRDRGEAKHTLPPPFPFPPALPSHRMTTTATMTGLVDRAGGQALRPILLLLQEARPVAVAGQGRRGEEAAEGGEGEGGCLCSGTGGICCWRA